MRDDVRPGLHVTNYKGRAVIAFDVDAEHVSIIGVSMAAKTTKGSFRTMWRATKSTETLGVL
jgi:hypothetical protein